MAPCNVVRRDLDLHFQGRKMLKHSFYKGCYFPSNESNANVVLRDLDIHFQGQNFSSRYFDNQIPENVNNTIAIR